MVDELRSILIRCLEHAPAVALCDASHPALSGLPAGVNTSQALALRFCVPEDREALAAADGDTFVYAYGVGEGVRAEVTVPWSSLLAVTGILEPGQRAAAIAGSAQLPEYMGAEATRRATAERMLACFSSLRVPSSWRIGGSGDSVVDSHAVAQPDKRIALVTLVERPGNKLKLLVRLDAEGVVLQPAGPPSGIVEIAVATQGLRTNGLRVEGHFQGDGAPHGSLSIPWGAIVGIQDAADGRGWGWPDEVPEALRVAVFGEAAALVAGRGRPLTAPAPLPLLALPAPPEENKRHALLACLRQGSAILLVSTQAEGVRLPGDFGNLPLLAVPLGLPAEFGASDTEITGLFVRTTLLDFNGRKQRLTLPWNAIFGVSTNEGALRVHAWSADYPEIVHAALRVGHHLGKTGELLSEPGFEPAEDERLTAPGLGLTKEDGQIRAILLQPVGPLAADGTRPTLEMEFMLPLDARG